jgi:hypothetical protein
MRVEPGGQRERERRAEFGAALRVLRRLEQAERVVGFGRGVGGEDEEFAVPSDPARGGGADLRQVRGAGGSRGGETRGSGGEEGGRTGEDGATCQAQ